MVDIISKKVEFIELSQFIKDIENLSAENLVGQVLINKTFEAIRIAKECFGTENPHNEVFKKICEKLKPEPAKNAFLVELYKMENELISEDSSLEDLGLASTRMQANIVNFKINWDVIHSAIVDVSRNRFEKGFFADSVESAFKEINAQTKKIVKEITSIEFDGSDLMFKAFKPEKPIIVLDDLSTMSGKNIQQGYMYLFAGAIMAARNPKTHEVIEIPAENAMHYIALASLLMNKLEGRP
ncbi:MAG: TIGR02391 family protein [Methanotrichaceae archaeon]|nr:TIGR02391 family protein [Methanotrichaceae archaeon]